MRELIVFVVYALATARASTMVRDDKILRGFRRWWIRRTTKGSLPRAWIGCIWCLSITAAVFPAVSWVSWPDHPVALGLCAVGAFSWLAVKADAWMDLLTVKIRMYAPSPPEPDDDSDDAEGTAHA